MKVNKIIKKIRKREGVAIIIIVGVLALLAVIGMVFAINTRLELGIAESYISSVKAKYLAEAGINHAIAELKVDVRDRKNFVYTDTSITPIINQPLGEGVYTVDIKDEQRRININNASQSLLMNLFLVKGISAASTKANDIVAYRTAHPFMTIEEIMAVNGIGKGTFNKIKDLITVTSYEDPNCSNRSPININTADNEVIEAVLVGLSDGINMIWPGDAKGVVSAIKDEIANNGAFSHPYGWSRFRDAVESAPGISTEKVKIIIANCNPNSDKTGLTQFTTEFCFCSGGHYSIISTGEVRENGDKVSERKTKGIIKIYDIWNETTKEQFADDNAAPVRVTWKDSCPINYDCLNQYTYNPDDAITIPNALKIGFWDDFEDAEYSYSVWHETGLVFEPYSISGGRLVTGGGGLPYPIEVLGDSSDWYFSDFSAIVNIEDNGYGPVTWPEGWIDQVPAPPDLPTCPGEGGYHQDAWGRWFGPVYQRYMNVGQLLFRRMGGSEAALYISRDQPEDGWVYEGWCYRYHKPPADLKNKLMLACGEDLNVEPSSYQPNKTFHLLAIGNYAEADAYWEGSSDSVSHTFGPLIPSEGFIALYGSANWPTFDNVRIIPVEGEYTSIEQAVGTIEQGTVSGTVTLLDTADEDTKVELNFANPGSSTSIQYKASLYSDTDDTKLQDTSVLEDVFVAYLKPTEVLYYTEVVE